MSGERYTPRLGEESVWDYPRPPRLEPTPARLRVVVEQIVVADTSAGYRVLETSHPPVYYFPPDDVDFRYLAAETGESYCEFKGLASYFGLVVDGRHTERVGWTYRDPTEEFAPLKDYVAFYPSKFDACYVGDELAIAQPGDFYGGWITSNVVGPFKGAPGTFGW